MEWIEKFKVFKTDRRPLTVGNCRQCNSKFEGLNIEWCNRIIPYNIYCDKCFAGSPQVIFGNSENDKFLNQLT